MKSADGKGHKLLTGFCLQALEMSRYRLSFAVNQLEQDWLEKLETYISDFLFTVQVDDTEDAVTMYVHAIRRAGVKFYGGMLPLVIFDRLCCLCLKSERLKESLGRDLINICAEILLDLTSCLDKLNVESQYPRPGTNAS